MKGMAQDLDRYFIASVLPPPIAEAALQLKHYFADHYHSKASLNSPPHITLHMPFRWKNKRESELIEGMKTLSLQLSSSKVELNNFGCFAPRVIYIQVNPSASLTAMQRQIRQFCKKDLGLFNADYQDLPFHPHVTLAFRDLKKPMFAKAWEEFRAKTFIGEFPADRIALLKHDGKKWDVVREFLLPA
jgi:2'-5' RNA ligase